MKCISCEKRCIIRDHHSGYCCVRFNDNGNLYLMTNPLIPGKDECEIEYLFSEETRSTLIGGKRLCLKDKYDTQKYYGKEIFSQYILDHFDQIDFSGFRPLLDTLTSVVHQ